MSGLDKYIKELQDKPEHEKRVILWFTTSLIFGIIFFVWLTTFEINFSLEPEEPAHKEPSPLDSVKSMAKGVGEDIGRGYGVLKDTLMDIGE
jgi:hypothetical protein